MSLQFIAGTDDFLVQRSAAQRWQEIATQFEDAEALESVNGHTGNVDEVEKAVSQFVAAVRTLSMFSPRKAVWLRGANFLADSKTGNAAGTLAAVDLMLECIDTHDQENVVILVSACPVDRRKKAYKRLQKQGDGQWIETGKDPAALLKMVEDEAAAAGARFHGNAARVLLNIVEGNTRLALEETRKLAAYVASADGTITSAIVTDIVPPVAESDFFAAAEAFYSLDISTTLQAIGKHFFAGNDARPLLATLQNRTRLLIQLKALIAGGKLPARPSQQALEAAARHCPWFGGSTTKTAFNIFSQNPWYVARLTQPLGRLSLRQLMDFQEAFRQALMDITSRPQEQEAVMRATAIRCLGALHG